MAFFVFAKVAKGRLSSYVKSFEIKRKALSVVTLFRYDVKQIRSIRRTSVTHSAFDSSATFLFLQHFDVICDLLLNRRTKHGICLLNGVANQRTARAFVRER